MSRIFQYELFDVVQGGKSFVSDYQSVAPSDLFGEHVTFCMNPLYTFGGVKDALGIDCLPSPGNLDARYVIDPAPFMLGNKDFTIEFSLFLSSGYGVPWETYILPFLILENSFKMFMSTSGGGTGGPVIMYSQDSTYGSMVGYFPWTHILANINKFNYFSITRKGTRCYSHHNGVLRDARNVPADLTFPVSDKPLYIMRDKDQGSIVGHSFSLRFTVGVARYEEVSLGPKAVNISGVSVAATFPTRLRRPFWHGHGFPFPGDVNLLLSEPLPAKQRGWGYFDPGEWAPVSWHDVADASRLKLSGLRPSPILLKGKPGVDRPFIPVLNGLDIFSTQYAMPKKVRTGVSSGLASNLGTVASGEFAIYCVLAQAANAVNASFKIAQSTWESGKLSFSLIYSGSAIVFQVYSSPSEYGERTIIQEKTVPFPMTTKESPAVFFMSRIGSTWFIGINNNTESLEYSPPTLSEYFTFSVSPDTASPGFIFFEAFSFATAMFDHHKDILKYLYSKHDIGAAISENYVQPEVYAETGALFSVKCEIERIVGSETSLYIPEERLTVLLNVDMSLDHLCTESPEGKLIKYVDASDPERVFSFPGFGDFNPRKISSWGSHFKTFSAVGDVYPSYRHLFSTKRYVDSLAGRTIFFVGKVPLCLLTQGVPSSHTDHFFYGMDSFRDPFRELFDPDGRYAHLCAKKIGEWGIMQGGDYVYDDNYTATGFIGDFVAAGLTSSSNDSVNPALPCILCYHGSGNYHTIYVNGEYMNLDGTRVPRWPAGDELRIGSDRYGSYGQQDEIAQLLILAGQISEEAMIKTIGQLAHKWRLSHLLSASFPYKNAPPLI